METPRLKACENKVPIRIFRSKRGELKVDGESYIMISFIIYILHKILIG
jgi:mRNA-degrading endonuclease HigB of HigAB toxin-antitoxin module